MIVMKPPQSGPTVFVNPRNINFCSTSLQEAFDDFTRTQQYISETGRQILLETIRTTNEYFAECREQRNDGFDTVIIDHIHLLRE
jgi:hypothetical protein